jgi:hypothetical protein
MRNSQTGTGDGVRPPRTGFRRARDALEEAGVAFRARKAAAAGSELPTQGELDIWLHPRAVPAADAALAAVGFHPFHAPGQGSHRFYLAFEEGMWLKLDAKLAEEQERSPPDPSGLLARTRRIGAALARRRLAAWRRLGPVVAVLGPDGAGKGTLVAGLQRSIPVAVKGFYLGLGRTPSGQNPRPRVAPDNSPAPEASSKRETSSTRARPVRESAYVVRKAVRDWSRLVPAYLAAWRGEIVLCDRHPIEVLAVNPRRARPAGAIERFVAARLTPRPDALIVLDAPGATLYRRKHEHSVELLERWRQSYRAVFVPLGATVISTTDSPGAALTRASEVVWAALCARRGW